MKSKFYFILFFFLLTGVSSTSFTTSNYIIDDNVEVLLSNEIDKQSVQCKGKTTKGLRCKNKTNNQ